MRGRELMVKKYVIGGVLALLFVGCTGKDKIPPMPPKSEKTAIEEQRTIAQMQEKLENIRNPIVGENISEQKRDAKQEIDRLIGDASRYKKEVSSFEKAQLLAYKKAKKTYHHKLKKSGKKVKKSTQVTKPKKETIDMVNEYENRLKYY